MEATGFLATDASSTRLIDAIANSAVARGSFLLAKITGQALTRLARLGATAAANVPKLFTDDEMAELVDFFEAAAGTADLLGRARIRAKWAAVLRSRGIDPFMARIQEDISIRPPQNALQFFSRLVPTLGVDPKTFQQNTRRTAFTMAEATSEELLRRVQSLITDRIASGDRFRDAPAEIAKALADLGITPRNSGYAEMVFRTNVMTAYNQGGDDETNSQDIQETFPVWQYSNPSDVRSRPEHAAKDGLYWPSSVEFLDVRGRDIGNAANCRCTKIMVDKWQWAKLKASGARTQVPMADPVERPPVQRPDNIQPAAQIQPVDVASPPEIQPISANGPEIQTVTPPVSQNIRIAASRIVSVTLSGLAELLAALDQLAVEEIQAAAREAGIILSFGGKAEMLADLRSQIETRLNRRL